MKGTPINYSDGLHEKDLGDAVSQQIESLACPLFMFEGPLLYRLLFHPIVDSCPAEALRFQTHPARGK